MKLFFFVLGSLTFANLAHADCFFQGANFPEKSILWQVNLYRECRQNQWEPVSLLNPERSCLYAGLPYPEGSILKQVNEYRICTRRADNEDVWDKFAPNS